MTTKSIRRKRYNFGQTDSVYCGRRESDGGVLIAWTETQTGEIDYLFLVDGSETKADYKK